MSYASNLPDDVRFPDGPEEPERPELKLYCHECNLEWLAIAEGWQCPECGDDGEIRADAEVDSGGVVLAYAVDNDRLVGVGEDVPAAVAHPVPLASAFRSVIGGGA